MIYLDYNATTPTDKQVVDAMIPMFTKYYGNPSSTHDTGADAADMVDDVRDTVSILVDSSMTNVVFTSGATEANNMAIAGFAANLDVETRILYGATEHKSVIGPCRRAEEMGADVMPVPVDSNGIIDADALAERLEVQTDLVSISLANGETGVINPIKEISKIVHDAGAILHSDITQALGKIPVSMHDMGIDIATCSSHKMYGPKGVGVFVASRDIRRNMIPLIYGGGQENGLRSGTENAPGIVGFGLACEIAYRRMPEESARQHILRDNFETRLKSAIPDVIINGETVERLPNTSNIRIRGALADAILVNTKKIELSSGSACSSSTMEPSHVLMAMGLDRTAADESIRISIGRDTTMEDMKVAVADIAQAAQYVRKKEAEITGSWK